LIRGPGRSRMPRMIFGFIKERTRGSGRKKRVLEKRGGGRRNSAWLSAKGGKKIAMQGHRSVQLPGQGGERRDENIEKKRGRKKEVELRAVALLTREN